MMISMAKQHDPRRNTIFRPPTAAGSSNSLTVAAGAAAHDNNKDTAAAEENETIKVLSAAHALLSLSPSSAASSTSTSESSSSACSVSSMMPLSSSGDVFCRLTSRQPAAAAKADGPPPPLLRSSPSAPPFFVSVPVTTVVSSSSSSSSSSSESCSCGETDDAASLYSCSCEQPSMSSLSTPSLGGEPSANASSLLSNDDMMEQPYLPGNDIAKHQASYNPQQQQQLSLQPSPACCSGSVPLALAEDEEVLSPLHCFMRRYCVEAFTATQADVSTPRYGKSHGGRIVLGQVGIRCIHCKHAPLVERKERAVCFPSSLKNIYHSIETFQRRHALACNDIPRWIKKTMTELMSKSRSGAGGRRQYWEESARRLGMIDTPLGIRFSITPGEVLPPSAHCTISNTAPQNVSAGTLTSNHHPVEIQCRGVAAASAAAAAAGGPVAERDVPIVCADDKALVTEYLFLLLDQMQVCRFSEQDRSGGRSKVKNCPVGYPGMQCKHCKGRAGFGRYYPATLQALTSANSDRNIYNHIAKCRRCPIDVRETLASLQRHQHTFKNRRGSRKLFFQRVWERLHGTGSTSSNSHIIVHHSSETTTTTTSS